ncbi:MAG: hypothetical protein IAF02_14145, partial [Anaerolineae bacterium]|nr:hypothetical protein [Anaerolineae bacterium]
RTLWQLQNALKSKDEAKPVLNIESDWIQLDHTAQLWVDTAVFETVFAQTNGKQGAALDETAVNNLMQAVQLYHGDLLEGWYQNWCLFERERYRQMRLMMLDKLVAYYESTGAYEIAISYGLEILRCDLARERTHRQLMRLYYLAGDRTGALRQYERCQAILHDELNVKPGSATEKLRTQIETDTLSPQQPETKKADAAAFNPHPSTASDMPAKFLNLHDTLHQLQRFDTILSHTRQEIQQEIQRLENTLSQSINQE